MAIGESRGHLSTTGTRNPRSDSDSRCHPERPYYRDSLGTIIRSDYPTQKAFCDATGLTEDLVSHVLARRKHLAIDTLSEALRRIGYRLAIVPIEKV